MSRFFSISRLIFIGALIVAAGLLLMPPPVGATPVIMRAAAIIVLAIGLWSTAVIPPYLGALVFLFAAMVLGVAPASAVFSGFHAGAMWLVFGGLVIGLAVQRTGLDMRLVRTILARAPGHYLSILYGIAIIAVALAFVIPSASGRVAMMVPIMVALAHRLGFDPGSRGYTGLVLGGAMGTMNPAFAILPANVPNMSLYGAAESILGYHLTFGDYILLNFPVLGIGGVLLYPLVIYALFGEAPKQGDHEEVPPAWSAAEGRLFVILLAALALWVTDTVHGVAPPWVALGAALLCLMPKVGMLPAKTLGELNYTPMFFLAGVIGLGAVATHSGIGALIADSLLPLLDLSPETPVRNFIAMTGLSSVVGIATTLPAAPSVMVPMAEAMAEASGWSIRGVLMTQVATWMVFPFPYQAPPVVVAIVLGDLRIGAVLKMLLTYMVVGLVLLLPLHYLWGRTLGVFL